jgi:signal transduction histidine kinase
VEEASNELRVIAFYDSDPEVRQMAQELFVGTRVPRTGISARVADCRGPAFIPTIEPKDEQLMAAPMYQEFLTRFPVYSLMAVPLMDRERVAGVVASSRRSPGNPYTEEHLSLLRDLVDRACLAMDNARLYRELKASVEVRDDFLAIAGHELRTPLAAMLMQIQGLQRAAKGNPDSRLVDRLAKAAGSGTRLERLINQLLDVSRISAGRIRLEPETINLTELLKEVVSRFTEAGATPASSITICCEGSVVGEWDRLRIEQVITNLVSNALKYGQGRPVEVELRVENAEVILRVTDHGIGIDEEHQQRLFQRFERAVATRDFGGFGLGLWISRQIVEASGGKIEVGSVAGGGSTFTVRLPVKSNASPKERDVIH